MGSLKPNCFLTPNSLVDTFMKYLTGNEYKILCVYVRRRYGSVSAKWQRVSEDDAARLAGISPSTASSCIDTLIGFGLLVMVEEADYTKGKARLFDVQTDITQVNEGKMQARLATNSEKNKARLKAARAANPKISDVCPTDTCAVSVGQTSCGICPTDNKKMEVENGIETSAPQAGAEEFLVPEVDIPFFGQDQDLQNKNPDPEIEAAKSGMVAHALYRQKIKAGNELPDVIKHRVRHPHWRDLCLKFAQYFPSAQFDYGTWIGRNGENIERFGQFYGGDEERLKAASKAAHGKDNTEFAIRHPVMLVPYLDIARINSLQQKPSDIRYIPHQKETLDAIVETI